MALASARATPAPAIQAVASARSPARTTSHAARLVSSSDGASKVAKAPRCRVGPAMANSAAPNSPARRPNRRVPVAARKAVAPSMNTRDRTRAAARPPAWSASAPSGGYSTGAPEK